VYEERRRESLRIMQETENRRAQIEEVVEFIESKLEELDAEKAELAEFQVGRRAGPGTHPLGGRVARPRSTGPGLRTRHPPFPTAPPGPGPPAPLHRVRPV
jgi:hypothetical protein